MASSKTVKTKDFKKVLKMWGLEHKSTKGSHERWSKKGMSRPVIVQNTSKEVPQFIFKNNLKTLGKSEKDFFDELGKK
jgi:predicted RNA binding protein YcfA (HicA-like mRNA interferase family)